MLADSDKAIELDPNLFEPRFNRGFAHLNLGDFEQAIADFDKAIELNPDFTLAYANRGFAYAELGDVERAIADYEKALSLVSDPGIRAELEALIEELGGR